MLFGQVVAGFLSAACAIECATLSGEIRFRRELTSKDLEHTKIELLKITPDVSDQSCSWKRTAFLHHNGTFGIEKIPEGTYALSVESIDYNLIPMKARVDVNSEDELVARLVQTGQDWDNLTVIIPLPLQIVPNPKNPQRAYIRERSPGLLKSGPIATVINNPLYLGGAILLLVFTVTPYILEKLDPETAKAVKEQKEAQRRGNPNKAVLEASEKLNIGNKPEVKESKEEAAKTDKKVKKRKS